MSVKGVATKVGGPCVAWPVIGHSLGAV